MQMNIILIILIQFLNCINNSEQLELKWQKVLVEKENLSPLKVKNISVITASKIVCGGSCFKIKWCFTWCSENANKCYLSDLIVSPSYELLSGINPLECYTKSRVDLVVGSDVYASPPAGPARPTSRLTNGIFCIDTLGYASIYTTNPWILFDLGKSALVSEVRFYPEPDDYYGRLYCENIEIRVGSSMVLNGDFSSYSYFGKQDGKCRPFEINSILATGTHTGQYIAIICKVTTNFALPSVEVEGVLIG